MVPRSRDTRILHTNFVLKRKCDVRGETRSYKAQIVVCGNGEYKNDEDTSLAVPDFKVIK